jgi:transcriptional regulator with XRE-family HTH domain/tetratricopeptide (TPR) repeat protein
MRVEGEPSMPPRSSPAPGTSTFAAVLRRERESAGLTQAELADRAGIGVRTVSNLERGINTSPYPSTLRLLADALGLAEEPRAELVGAAGRHPDAGRDGAPSGGYLGARPVTSLVARDGERTAITAALTAAAASQGAVVLLAGEPGIGKTRLAQEAIELAGSRGFLVASGRCFEQQSATPFVPLLEVFATLHQAAPPSLRNSTVERWPALAPLLPDAFPSADPPAWTSPEAVQLLHRAATAFVGELAASQPLALVIDDLHWADGASADLLTYLVRHTTTDRVLLLGTYRDAEVGSAHPVRTLAHALRRERLTRAIRVERFDRDMTARLIAQRLDEQDLADEVSDLVHRHSEGNPFFTVEIVTALVERGDLAQVEGHWVCRELDAVEAPVSVSEAIGQRVSRLSAPARAVLEAASVLGPVFDPDDVPVGDPSGNTGELESALDEAVDAGLLGVIDDGYAFDHSLTQQALHLGMSPVRRRRLHREVGERLERRPAAARRRRAAEIAQHLEAGGLLDRAVEYALLAGDVAAGVFARAEAVRLYAHAHELAEEVGDEKSGTAALERLGQIELTTGRYDEALRHLLEAAQRHRRAGDVAARLRVEGMIADLQHRRGEGEEAARRLDEVLAELDVDAGPDGWVAGGAALATGLARVRLFLGQHQLCVEATELATRLAQQEASPAAGAEARAVGGTALFFLDRSDDAVRVLEEGVALAATIDAPTLESGVLMGLQWATTMRGELARSLELGERGLELTRRAGNTVLESQHAAGLGHTLYYTGDWEAAEHHLVQGLELARAGSPTLFSGIPPVYLGLLRAGQGDAEAAIACYDEAATAPDLQTFAFAGYLQARRAELDLRDGDAVGALARLEPWLEAEAPTKVHDVMLLVVATQACLALGDVARAEIVVTQALRRAQASCNRIDAVDARRLLGVCQQQLGRADQAREHLVAALELAVAIGYPAAEARVRADLAALDHDGSLAR